MPRGNVPGQLAAAAACWWARAETLKDAGVVQGPPSCGQHGPRCRARYLATSSAMPASRRWRASGGGVLEDLDPENDLPFTSMRSRTPWHVF